MNNQQHIMQSSNVATHCDRCFNEVSRAIRSKVESKCFSNLWYDIGIKTLRDSRDVRVWARFASVHPTLPEMTLRP